jgi:hypothetical protein
MGENHQPKNTKLPLQRALDDTLTRSHASTQTLRNLPRRLRQPFRHCRDAVMAEAKFLTINDGFVFGLQRNDIVLQETLTISIPRSLCARPRGFGEERCEDRSNPI